MDDTYRPVEKPFGPDEPDFTHDVVQGAYVDEVPGEAPPGGWDAEDTDDEDVEPIDTEFDGPT